MRILALGFLWFGGVSARPRAIVIGAVALAFGTVPVALILALPSRAEAAGCTGLSLEAATIFGVGIPPETAPVAC